jgi:hypothetical protein
MALLMALCELVLQPLPLPSFVCQWEGAAAAAGAQPPICVTASRCVGSLLNRVPEAAVVEMAAIVEAAAGAARASGDAPRRHRAALLYVWAVKGLLQRSHPKGAAFLSTLLDWLAEAGEERAPAAGAAAAPCGSHAFASSKDPMLVLIVGGGLFSATEENEPMSEFSAEAGGNLRGTYRQRMFAVTKARCSGDVRGGGAAALFAVCSMLTHLPPAVLLQDAGGNMALVVRSLQLVAASAPAGGGGGSDGAGPEPAAPDSCATMVNDSVRVAALKSLVCIVTRAPAAAEPHVIALAEPLLSLARFAGAPQGPKPLVRACALDALRALAMLPHARLHPVREKVLRGLLPVLDDPKRVVRRRAGACRNDWAARP